GDGILDGVEMDLLVRGTEKIDVQDFYNCSDQGISCQIEDVNEFSLEIPDRGRVYDANMMMQIDSGDTLIGKGNVSIEFFIKIRDWEKTIFTYQEDFDINDNFQYKKTLDLSNLVANGIIREYYQKYFLRVKIQDTHPNDTFYISEFCIETDTFIQAGHLDTNAWLTDPALSDSDLDGWTDGYQIFTSLTNPLNKDTDGDN
ncbi:unnamed protein product, partial [marine sediment metagenome]